MFFGDYTCLICRGIIQLQVPFKTLEVMSQSQKLPVHPNVLHIPVSNDDPILHSSSVPPLHCLLLLRMPPPH